MQVYMAMVRVTINTLEPVTPEDVKEELSDCLGEFGGGPAEVVWVRTEQWVQSHETKTRSEESGS